MITKTIPLLSTLLVVGLALGWVVQPSESVPVAVATSATSEIVPVVSEETAVLPSVEKRFQNDTDEAPDFQRHVIPLLGRLGCNARACHGSFQGQGGFQLSLFGYDFSSDHSAITEDGSWRVNTEDPTESLILAKPSDADLHEGGLRFTDDSWQYRLLKNWVTAGAKDLVSDLRLQKLEVTPNEILTGAADEFQLQVIAHWSNGTAEDVTPLTRFQSNDPQVASVDEDGLVVGGAQGDTHVIVFYDNEVVNVPVLFPSTTSTKSGMPFDNPTPIDQLVMDKLNKLNIHPSILSDDTTFLRRVSLDVTGTLPTPDQIESFIADNDPDKRTKKIESLLETNAYAAWWTTFLCDMTGNNSNQLRRVSYSDTPSKAWYQWIYKRVSENTPYDEIIRGIVLSETRTQGESFTDYSERMSDYYRDPTAASFADLPTMPYYWMRQDFQAADTRAISFAHSFLGVRIQCAQCHKHPFDQWTQDDFQQFSRFFSGVTFARAQRVGNADKEELQKILEAIGLDEERSKKLNNGQKRQLLERALKQGKTIPVNGIVVGPPRKSRQELREDEKKIAQQIEQMRQDTMSEMSGDGDTETKKPLTRKERQELARTRRREAQKIRNRNRYYTDAMLLGSDAVELTDFEDARQPAMSWLVSDANPYFAKAIVNRIWAQYFGVGIVEPADDLNLANPPSNGPLLEYLANGFVDNGYDLKWVHRQITNSHIYQLSWQTNESNQHDRRNFSHALPRRLPAEVLFDAINQATVAPERLEDFPSRLKGRAISIPGTTTGRNNRRGREQDREKMNPGFAMRVFGRSERVNSCDCDRSNETSLIQTVYLQNDIDMHRRLGQEGSWIHKMFGTGIALSKEERKRLTRMEEQLRTLRVNLRKATNREQKNQMRRLANQIESLQDKLKSLRARRDEAVKRIEQFDREELISEAWLRTLSRYPTEEEIATCQQYFDSTSTVRQAMMGIMWSLLNTKEFIVNH